MFTQTPKQAEEGVHSATGNSSGGELFKFIPFAEESLT